jgi:hypothetical protein
MNKPIMFLYKVRAEGQSHRIFKDALDPADDPAMWTALFDHEPVSTSLLRPAISTANPLPPGCYCPPGECQAPRIMGRQAPCRRDANPLPAAPAPRRATPEQEAEINAAVKAGRITFEPGWNDQRPAEQAEQAPANSLPTWGECNLIIENHEFRIRAEAGLEGAVLDTPPTTPVPTELHRFIYEYDDADECRSAWFMHRLEKLLEETALAARQAPSVEQEIAAMSKEIDRQIEGLTDFSDSSVDPTTLALANEAVKAVAARQAPDSRDAARLIWCFHHFNFDDIGLSVPFGLSKEQHYAALYEQIDAAIAQEQAS